MVHGDGFSRSGLLRRVSRVIAPSPCHNTADQSAPSTLTAVYRPTGGGGGGGDDFSETHFGRKRRAPLHPL